MPKIRPVRLTLTELELATCARLTRLLTLNLARIACEESGLLQHRTHLSVDFAQCACDAQTSGLGLSLDTAAIEIDDDVVVLDGVGSQQGLLHLELQDIEREVCLESLTVDCNLTFTRFYENAGDSGLTSTYGVYNFHTLLT